MTRLKERLDRRIARMSNDAKVNLSSVLLGVVVLWTMLTGGSLMVAVLGYLIDDLPFVGGWWWLGIPGFALCLAVTVAFCKLSFYVVRDVPMANDWWW